VFLMSWKDREILKSSHLWTQLLKIHTQPYVYSYSRFYTETAETGIVAFYSSLWPFQVSSN
jgi:hypothetical protein